VSSEQYQNPIVGIGDGAVVIVVPNVVTLHITPQGALDMSRNLMRMAFILEPPAETKAEEKP
jgi:hypothetical protein